MGIRRRSDGSVGCNPTLGCRSPRRGRLVGTSPAEAASEQRRVCSSTTRLPGGAGPAGNWRGSSPAVGPFVCDGVPAVAPGTLGRGGPDRFRPAVQSRSLVPTTPGVSCRWLLIESGTPSHSPKVARDTAGAEALARERDALERWGPLLPPPLHAPGVLDSANGILILEPGLMASANGSLDAAR